MLKDIKHFTYLRLLHFFLKENAHVNFLFSMTLLVVLSPYLEERNSGRLGVTLIATYNVLATLYYIIHDKRNYWVTALALLIIASDWFTYLGFGEPFEGSIVRFFDVITSFGVTIIFLWALIKLFTTIFYAAEVDIKVIISSISGYLALGLIGAFGFQILGQIEPGSLIVAAGDALNRHDMVYFSFVTMSTLGYGDLLPVGPLARGMAILVTLSGQMYMTMVVAMIIGKYIVSDQNRTRAQNED